MKIEITMEKIQRIAMEFDATEEQFKLLEMGENPFFEKMKEELESGASNIDYDYAVTDEKGNTLIDWD